MDFEKLKLGFESYLLKLEDPENGKTYDISNNDKSIFKYSKEFRDYLSTSDDTAEFRDRLKEEGKNNTSIFTMSLVEIKEKIQEKGFIDPKLEEDEETQEPKDTQETQEENQEEQIENEVQEDNDDNDFELFMGVLKDMLKDDDIRNIIDTDGVEGISQEELFQFLDTIKSYDGTQDTITFEDMEEFAKDVAEYNYFDEITTQEDVAPIAPKRNENGTQTLTSGNYRGITSKPVEKTIANMTLDELKKELTEVAEPNLANKQELLYSIRRDDDSSPVYDYKKAMDEAYASYQGAILSIDPNSAQILQNYKENIGRQEKLISDKEDEFFREQNAYTSAKTTYDNAVIQLSVLEELDTSDMDSAQAQKISDAISSAKIERDKAKEEMDRAQERINEIPEEKRVLEATLSGFISNKEDFEDVLLDENKELKALKEAYDNTKQEYDTKKAQAIKEARQAVQEAQKNIDDINTQISVREIAQYTTEGKMVDFANSFVGRNEADGSADIFVNGGSSAQIPWCAAFVSYVANNSIGRENLMDWYNNCGNQWYCPTIYNAAKQAEAQGNHVILSADEAYAGCAILFDYELDGRQNHIGLVTDVVHNPDGTTTIYTTEGNTSNQVRQKSYTYQQGKMTIVKIANT